MFFLLSLPVLFLFLWSVGMLEWVGQGFKLKSAVRVQAGQGQQKHTSKGRHMHQPLKIPKQRGSHYLYAAYAAAC